MPYLNQGDKVRVRTNVKHECKGMVGKVDSIKEDAVYVRFSFNSGRWIPGEYLELEQEKVAPTIRQFDFVKITNSESTLDGRVGLVGGIELDRAFVTRHERAGGWVPLSCLSVVVSPQFKVGDRVRLADDFPKQTIHGSYGSVAGNTGVIDYQYYGFMFHVNLDIGAGISVRADSLEHLPTSAASPSPSAAKVYVVHRVDSWTETPGPIGFYSTPEKAAFAAKRAADLLWESLKGGNGHYLYSIRDDLVEFQVEQKLKGRVPELTTKFWTEAFTLDPN